MICVLLLLTFHLVDGECPNACSQHGLCDFYDMCNCFRGFTGGDCSERMCPYDYSFVTTPQGDLNMDGDRDDNSWRRLSQHIRSFTVGGSTITVNGVLNPLETVTFGDLIKVHDQVLEVQWACTYVVSTGCSSSSSEGSRRTLLHTNTTDHAIEAARRLNTGSEVVMATTTTTKPTTDLCRSCTRQVDYPNTVLGERWTELTVESRMDGLLHGFVGVWATPEEELLTDAELLVRQAKIKKNLNGHPMYRHLRTQSQPYGTWEKWPGNFFGAGQVGGTSDEGHFYMECSNRGLCNRLLGVCQCHTGYTGKACHLQTCPGILDKKGSGGVASENAVGDACNGRGTCLTVSQLARAVPNVVLGGIRVSTQAGSAIVHTEKDLTLVLFPGDRLMIGVEHDVGMSNNRGRTGSGRSGSSRHTFGTQKQSENIIYSNGANRLYSKDLIVKTVFANRIVLTNPYYRSLPYGTELRQIRKYHLWDAHKNRACKCNHRYHGHSCKLKKCPRGDNPLTELGYDTLDSSVTHRGKPSAVSFYEQRPERQTIYMSTNGTCVLVFSCSRVLVLLLSFFPPASFCFVHLISCAFL